MEKLIGIWKLVEARAFDNAGRQLPPPFGPYPIGTVTFTTDRMAGVAADGRASLTPGSPSRFFIAYTGTYSFDGEVLVTHADDASRPELIVEQVRRIRFETKSRMVATPISGVLGHSGVEVVWERVG